jgi:hypothetical protein
LAFDIKIAAKIMPEEVPDNEEGLENTGDNEKKVEFDLDWWIGIGLFEWEMNVDSVAEGIGLNENEEQLPELVSGVRLLFLYFLIVFLERMAEK